MNKQFLPFMMRAALAAFFACAGVAHAQKAQPSGIDADAARELTIAVTTEVMNIVKNDPSITKDMGRLTRLVDQKILRIPICSALRAWRWAATGKMQRRRSGSS